MPMAYSQNTQNFYIPSNEWGMDIWNEPISYKKGAAYLGAGFTIKPIFDDHIGALKAIDPKTGEIVWHYQNDEMGGQHDAQMLENGNILIFANGAYASDLHHSQVWEIDPGTNEIVWRYRSKDNPQRFFSPHVGGCQRLASGNTLICEGAKGCVFEVTPDGDVVWEYVCPYFNEVPGFGKLNWLFRARHYPPGSPELKGLL